MHGVFRVARMSINYCQDQALKILFVPRAFSLNDLCEHRLRFCKWMLSSFHVGAYSIDYRICQGNYKGINSHVTKSVVPTALALLSYTRTSNAVGMTDFPTPTLVGGTPYPFVETTCMASLWKETESTLFVVSVILNRSSILLLRTQVIFLLLSITHIFSLSVNDIFWSIKNL